MMGLAVALTTAGLLSMGFFSRQLFFLITSVLLAIIFSFFDWRMFKSGSTPVLLLYLSSIVLLIGLFFVPAVRDVHRWYNLGFASFDPKELAKLALIILLAKYFSSRHEEMYNVRHLILTGLYTAIPAGLIFMQPDLGSSLLVIFIWLSILLVAGVKKKHLIVMVILGVIAGLLAWNLMVKDYQKERLTGFLNPEADPLGASWSQNQARIAIGSGGWLGRGLWRGPQTRQGFLPEPTTDFIFSAWAEETGFIGVLLLCGLFIGLVSRVIRVAFRSGNNFVRLFSAGVAIHIVLQLFINIGMNMGLLPITGTPLPFVSYGGSGLVFLFISIGLLQSMLIGENYRLTKYE